MLSGDVSPSGEVLIYNEAGDHAGLQAAEIALNAGATVDIMTPTGPSRPRSWR